jgi:ABC-type multidrug transport system ATPase subunit
MNTVVTLPLVGRDICKTFRRATGEVVRALDGVSLEVRHGTLTALVGPDGAGKTTLIRLMAGLMAPDSGALKVLDLDVVAQPQAAQDRIGYMPQKFGLYEDLSVTENLDPLRRLARHRRSRTRAAISALAGDDRARALHQASGRTVVGRHEAKARPCLHARALARVHPA